MPFIEHKPSRILNTNSDDVMNSVKISFSKRKQAKKPLVSILIGKTVASKIGITHEKKIIFFVDDQNNKKWLIKKSESDDQGYKISEIKKGASLKAQFTLNIDDLNLNESDYAIKKVKHDIHDGGILLFVD